MNELLIRIHRSGQFSELESFLRGKQAQPRIVDANCLAVDLDAEGCPTLATLVAEVDHWRSSSRAGEVVIELDGEARILRTET